MITPNFIAKTLRGAVKLSVAWLSRTPGMGAQQASNAVFALHQHHASRVAPMVCGAVLRLGCSRRPLVAWARIFAFAVGPFLGNSGRAAAIHPTLRACPGSNGSLDGRAVRQ